MTPERAKELAEANGLEWYMSPVRGLFFATRPEDERLWRGYTMKEVQPGSSLLPLAEMSEAEFIANLPDKRD